MESEVSLRQKGGNYDVVVEIQSPANQEPPTTTAASDFQEDNGVGASLENQMEDIARAQINLFLTTPQPQPTASAAQNPPPDSGRPPISPASSTLRQRTVAKSAYSKPKSRIAEPPYPTTTAKPAQENAQNPPPPPPKSPSAGSPSLKPTPRTSAPVTPRTPLMSSIGGDSDDDGDGDDEVYKPEILEPKKANRGKKFEALVIIEWAAFISITGLLIASRTIDKLKGCKIWSLELWKWSVLSLVIICGRLFTDWIINSIVFLIEKNFLLKKKVLYFVFALRKSVRIVFWLALILLAWALLINRGVKRSENTSKVLNYITRGIVSTLVGASMWTIKTLLVKIIAASFHVRTYFDRIQESIFHQYILQSLSGPPTRDFPEGDRSSKISGQLSFSKLAKKGTQTQEVIDVDKLYKIKREKVSAWTMGGLIKVIRNSELPTISEVIDETVEEEEDSRGPSAQPKVITSEIEARDAANRIFKNVAKRGHKYIDEGDLLRFMPKEEVDNAIPLFEGAAETKRIKKSAFRNWVVKAYNERKCLAVSLSDAKTAVEELNRISSGLVLIVIVIVWLLLMEVTTTRVLVFISSQLLLVVFMFGNTAKTVFEAMVFVFVVHPFDVGDRCVVDGVQMVVDEMNILTTIFLKSDNEKVYYPNAVLATKPISNFNRSPEMMGDSIEFAVDFSTSSESIAALKAKIKAYLESKPQQWNPSHSVQIKEIVDVHKMVLALYVTHTINFQNSGERGNRRSDLVFELKRILEELGIKFSLLPQPVHVTYVRGANDSS